MRFLLVVAALFAVLLFGAPALLGWSPIDYAGWWLTNTSPPQVQLVGPDGVAKGVVSLQVRSDDRPQADVVDVRIDDTPITPDWSMRLDTSSLPDGPHRVQVQVRDRSFHKNTASAELALETDNTPPTVDVQLDPETPTEGRTLLVRIRTEADATVSGELDGKPLAVQPGSAFHWALAGFAIDPQDTAVRLAITATDRAGNRTDWSQSYELQRTKYPLEHVELPATLEPLLDPEIRTQEDAELAAVYTQVNGPPRWRGPFDKPAPGPITTIFGISRTYNGHDYLVHHPGIDFAGVGGQEILASNDGVVAYTGQRELRGNMVIVDHGAGVYSTYAHMSEILVHPGEAVKKGDVVGRAGSTGLSTGPHLHWEVWVGGVNVDPTDWAEREYP